MIAGASAVLGMLVLMLGALVVSDTLRIGGGQLPALAGPGEEAAVQPLAVATGPPCRAPLVPEDPLRVWIGGDSLAGTLGPALGERVAATGVAQPVYDYRESSGLANPGFFDWAEHAAAEMVRLDPEIVVFIIGANDWGTPRREPLDATGEPAWKSDYAASVRALLDLFLADPERTVYWVGSPPLRSQRQDAGVIEINAVANAVVDGRFGASFIDPRPLFTDIHGAYTATIPDADGGTMRVRTSDGIHFTPAGADLLAEFLSPSIDNECQLEAQSVPGQAKEVIKTPGSGRVKGSGTSDTTTTLPSPAPPDTTTSSTTTESTTTTSESTPP